MSIDKLKHFWQELQKRNIFRVFTFYALTAWLLIQFAVTTFPYLNFPEWTIRLVIMLSIIGLPVVLVISWAFEITKDGLKKTKSVALEKSIGKKTGEKLNHLIIGVLALVVVFCA